MRAASRESTLRHLLQAGGTTDFSRLTVVVADLDGDAGWREAAQGCDAVLHMANLPLDVNVQFMTIMASKMPFVGRG